MIIFVTGKSGSGKSLFAKTLSDRLNYSYIDVDKIGHSLYERPEVLSEITRLFGQSIFDEDGSFNRKKLGKIIFSEKHSNRVKKFNTITWNYMQEILDNRITDDTIIDWILTPSTKYWKMKSLKILIKPVDDESRIQSIISRDNTSREYIELRDKSGIEYNKSDFDFIFTNDYSQTNLDNNVNKIVNYITSLPNN